METNRIIHSNVNASKNKARRFAIAASVALAVVGMVTGCGAQVVSAAPSNAPGAPTKVVAAAGSTSAALSWTAPSSDGGQSLTGYYVTAHRGSITSRPKWFPSAGNTAKVTGLRNGIGYQFTVVAANADEDGAPSGWSNYITPAALPGTPKSVAVTASSGGATVWWAAAKPALDPTTAYLITPYVDGDALTPRRIQSTVTAQTITGLNEGTSYRFEIQAVNAIGNSRPSALTNSIKVQNDPTTFIDTFTGPAHSGPNAGLAKPVWNLDGCWRSGCGNGSDAQYLMSNSSVTGQGDLALRATHKTTGATCGSERCHYTGAGLEMFNSDGSPTFSQEYGTFSARIKLPAGSGLWPAFWLAGSNAATAGWPVCGEIDALEADGGNRTTVQQHIHYGHTNTQIGSGWRLPRGQATTGWHTYAITWSPAGIVWKVDGRSTMVVLASRVGASAWRTSFSHPFSLILDLTVGGKYVTQPKASSFPATMLVDDVQVTKS